MTLPALAVAVAMAALAALALASIAHASLFARAASRRDNCTCGSDSVGLLHMSEEDAGALLTKASLQKPDEFFTAESIAAVSASRTKRARQGGDKATGERAGCLGVAFSTLDVAKPACRTRVSDALLRNSVLGFFACGVADERCVAAASRLQQTFNALHRRHKPKAGLVVLSASPLCSS